MNNWEWKIDHNTFDLINLQFFVNYRFTTLIQYLGLYLVALLKVAFVVSDIYTAVKLIVFNTWTSDIQPFISYTICRWLFFACIALSVVFYIYSFARSVIAYRTDNVSLTYINSGAMFMKSVRSYKNFCVYNEISSDSFFSYLAIFTYFTLQDCIVLLLCDTPRQVINGITIFKILKFNSSMIAVIKEIATTNRTEAIMLSFMTFSFVIWFLFFVRFLFACLLYLPIHHKIKYELRYKHGLKQYCCIKINHCIKNFMKVKHSKSLEQVKRENLDVHPNIPNLPDAYDGDGDDDDGDDSDLTGFEKIPSQFEVTDKLRQNSSQSTLPAQTRQNSSQTAAESQLRNPFTSSELSLSSVAEGNPFAGQDANQQAYHRPFRRIDRTDSDIAISGPPLKNPFVERVRVPPPALSSAPSLPPQAHVLAPPPTLVPRSASADSGFSHFSSSDEASLNMPTLDEDFLGTPAAADIGVDELEAHRAKHSAAEALGLPRRMGGNV